MAGNFICQTSTFTAILTHLEGESTGLYDIKQTPHERPQNSRNLKAPLNLAFLGVPCCGIAHELFGRIVNTVKNVGNHGRFRLEKMLLVLQTGSIAMWLGWFSRGCFSRGSERFHIHCNFNHSRGQVECPLATKTNIRCTASILSTLDDESKGRLATKRMDWMVIRRHQAFWVHHFTAILTPLEGAIKKTKTFAASPVLRQTTRVPSVKDVVFNHSFRGAVSLPSCAQ